LLNFVVPELMITNVLKAHHNDMAHCRINSKRHSAKFLVS